MYYSFDENLTEFTYLIERISIVTKEFLNKLEKNSTVYNLIYRIYKSTQSINYEFIKLCYNIRLDKTLNVGSIDIDKVNISVPSIRSISEYKTFLHDSNNSLKSPLNFICESSKKYSQTLTQEIDKFICLVNNLNENC